MSESSVVATCVDCGKDFIVSAERMVEVQILDDNDDSVRGKLLICPECNAHHIVQIDNKDTQELFLEQIKLLRKIGKSRAYMRSEKAVEKMQQKSKLLAHRLSVERSELCVKYKDHAYYFQGEKMKVSCKVPNLKILG